MILKLSYCLLFAFIVIMKVILKDSGEIKDVSFGYAVNYLLPHGLAEVATKEKIKLALLQKKEKEKKLILKREEDKNIAQKFENKSIKIKGKVAKGKKLFGSIGKQEIIQALDADPKRIELVLAEPIKKLGKYKVYLKIGVEKTSINIEVVKE